MEEEDEEDDSEYSDDEPDAEIEEEEASSCRIAMINIRLRVYPFPTLSRTRGVKVNYANAKALVKAPQAPMISVEEAEKQANKLKAEIATLTESLAQERARTVALQAVADAANEEKDTAHRARDVAELEMQVLRETHARESGDHRTQLDTLKASTDREREALNQQQEAMEKKHEYFMDVMAKRRSGFEVERDRAQKAILEHRKSVLENFDQMTKLLQPNPFPITYQGTDLVPAPGESSFMSFT
ncbi:hypothetical protein B0H14DRAFT_3851634 [Mycena olivaceomarginata]|nr:hypothetical protein B0H14DRAFT_3851634 [Mycena olivaceomarginata]